MIVQDLGNNMIIMEPPLLWVNLLFLKSFQVQWIHSGLWSNIMQQ